MPLRILSRRLFFGIGAKRVMAQEQVSLNGTEAIHTLLEGRVKDAEVMVSSYVAKDATCVYDLVYVAARAAFEERLRLGNINGILGTGGHGGPDPRPCYR